MPAKVILPEKITDEIEIHGYWLSDHKVLPLQRLNVTSYFITGIERSKKIIHVHWCTHAQPNMALKLDQNSSKSVHLCTFSGQMPILSHKIQKLTASFAISCTQVQNVTWFSHAAPKWIHVSYNLWKTEYYWSTAIQALLLV
jgi:hypothetical protein